jgi:hypothetical protein
VFFIAIADQTEAQHLTELLMMIKRSAKKRERFCSNLALASDNCQKANSPKRSQNNKTLIAKEMPNQSAPTLASCVHVPLGEGVSNGRKAIEVSARNSAGEIDGHALLVRVWSDVFHLFVQDQITVNPNRMNL